MTDRSEFDLDRALARMAARMGAEGPDPSEALVTRVLSDAATISAVRRNAASGAARPAEQARPRRPSLAGTAGGAIVLGERLPVAWVGVAATAMLLCLALGLYAGVSMGPAELSETGFATIDLPF